MEGASENVTHEDSSRQKPFASLIVFDTEATGFKRHPRITELCMLAVQTDELTSTTKPIPRVINKLQLCFNPESVIQPDVSILTGLYNDVLEQLGTFTDQASLITSFLATLPKPVCIIAHNGHCFDFPLLQRELCKANQPLPGGVYCADSLETFRVLDGLPAIPEWVLRREKEEKLRKDKACATNSTPLKANNPTGNCVVLTVRPHSESAQREYQALETESSTVSPNKRQMNCMENSTDKCASVTKLSKTDAAPSFGFQPSVSDDDLVEAYYAAIAEMSTGDVGGCVSPVADSSLQSVQETTPEKDSSWTNPVSVPGPVVKKRPTVFVSPAQRDRVTRRLFVEEPDAANNRSLRDALKDDAVSELGHIASAAEDMLSLQGRLYDDQIVEAVCGITSLTPFNAGGEPVGQKHQTQTRDQVQTVCAQIKNTSSSSSRLPAVTRLGVSASSKQNQGPDVTTSSSSSSSSSPSRNAPRHPENGTLPNALQPSASTAPKVSYKLVEIYKRHFGTYPDVAHCAEDDCLTLLKVILRKRSEFMTYVEKHAVRLDSVEPMY
ncbi:hypothetical protein ACOMHN_024190 [Nucella lapillus]